jgi:hypothetical protein
MRDRNGVDESDTGRHESRGSPASVNKLIAEISKMTEDMMQELGGLESSREWRVRQFRKWKRGA